MKKYYIILIAVFGLLIFTHVSYAASWTLNFTSDGSGCGSDQGNQYCGNVSQFPTDSTGIGNDILYLYCPNPVNQSNGNPVSPSTLAAGKYNPDAYGWNNFTTYLGNDWYEITRPNGGWFDGNIPGYKAQAWGFGFADSGTSYNIDCGGTASAGTILMNDTGPTNVGATLTFLYPQNGSTTTAFTQYQFEAQHVSSTDAYYVYDNDLGYIDGQYAYQLECEQSTESSGSSTVYISVNRYQLNQGYCSIQYQNNSINIANATSAQWTSNATLYDLLGTVEATSSISWTELVATSGIPFILTVPATSTVGTTTQLLTINPAQPQNYSTSTYQCSFTGGSISSDISGGLAYGLCEAVYYTLNPNSWPQAQQYLGIQLTNFQKAPPFSVLFGIAQDITSTAQTNSFSEVNIGILGYPNQQQVNLVTLSSTTFNNGTGTATHSSHPTTDATNYMETYISMTVWIAAAIKLLHIMTA